MSSLVINGRPRCHGSICIDNNINTESELINSPNTRPITIVSIAQIQQNNNSRIVRPRIVQASYDDSPATCTAPINSATMEDQQHYHEEEEQQRTQQMYPRHLQQRQYHLYNQPVVIPVDIEFANNNQVRHQRPPVGEIVIIPRNRGTTSSNTSQSTTSELRDSVNSSSESNSTSQSNRRKSSNHSKDQLQLSENNRQFLMSKIDVTNRELLVGLQLQQSMMLASPMCALQQAPTRVHVPALNPLKIARPVPQRAAEVFYRTAHELQLPSNEIQDAIVQSNEWHRKWTHQDETPALYTNTNAEQDDDDTFEIVFENRGGTLSSGQSHTELSLDTLSPKEQEHVSKNKRNASTWLTKNVSQHHVVDNDEDVESDDPRQRYPNNGSHWVDLLAADREGGARNPSPDADETVISTSVDGDEQSLYVGSPSRGDEILNNPMHQGQGSPPPTSYTDCPMAYLERIKCECLVTADNDIDNTGNTNESGDDDEDFVAPLLTHREEYMMTQDADENDIEDGQMGQLQERYNVAASLTVPAIARPSPRRPIDNTAVAAPIPQGPVIASLVRPVALRPRDHVVEKSLSTRSSSKLNCMPPVQHIIQDDRSITSQRSWYNRRSMSPLTVSTMGGGNNDSITSSTRYYNANKKHKMIRSQSDDPVDYPNDNINTYMDEYHPGTEEEGAIVNIIECDDADIDMPVVVVESTWILCPSILPSTVSVARDGIFNQLAISHGNTDSPQFLQCLQILQDHYRMECTTRSDCMESPYVEDGTWLTLTKPTFFGNLGDNDNGDPMYTLGRMSFDMFSPTSIVCSLQGTFNSVKVISDENRRLLSQTNRDSEYDHYCAIPKKLQDEVDNGESVMRTYE
jgi:hypothetical protein